DLLIPWISRPTISYPAAGTLSISIFPLAPTNRSTVSGAKRFNALAMAMAGKICPPVPPPLMMIRLPISLSLLFASLLPHCRDFADNHFLALLVRLAHPLHLIDVTAHTQNDTESQAGKQYGCAPHTDQRKRNTGYGTQAYRDSHVA